MFIFNFYLTWAFDVDCFWIQFNWMSTTCSGHDCVCSLFRCILRSSLLWGHPGTKTDWNHPQLPCEWRGVYVCVCKGVNPSLRCCVSAAWATRSGQRGCSRSAVWGGLSRPQLQSCQAQGGGGELSLSSSLSDPISHHNMLEENQAKKRRCHSNSGDQLYYIS